MDNEFILASINFLRTAVKIELERRKKTKKRLWVKKWISNRDSLGASSTLLKELAVDDQLSYRNIMWLNTNNFDNLLCLTKNMIQRQDTNMRMALPAKLKLEITLRFLATGDSFKSLQYLFRVPACTISKFLPEVLDAIIEALKPYLKVPVTKDEWEEIYELYNRRWNFPKCCGSIDGKHVQIKKPINSGSQFHNYKGSFSIILFALVDANYCFRYLDIGANGRSSDSAIFRDSTLSITMENDTIDFPDEHVIIGDDAFPLRSNLMKPYSKRNLSDKEIVFNYRLSRARRVVENAFGILVWRFRVFSRQIELQPQTVDKVIWSACALHNWLRMTNSNAYFPSNAVDTEDLNTGSVTSGLWRNFTSGLPSTLQLGSNNYTRNAESIRKK